MCLLGTYIHELYENVAFLLCDVPALLLVNIIHKRILVIESIYIVYDIYIYIYIYIFCIILYKCNVHINLIKL